MVHVHGILRSRFRIMEFPRRSRRSLWRRSSEEFKSPRRISSLRHRRRRRSTAPTTPREKCVSQRASTFGKRRLVTGASVMADQLISTVEHRVLPESYVRPYHERPHLQDVVTDDNIPLIDLGDPESSKVISRIGEACRDYGFFQVLNHGVPEEIVRGMRESARDFFRLPPEEKAKHYSDDPTRKMRLSTSFNVRKEKIRNWRDYLRLHCFPLRDYLPGWPSNPPSFREAVGRYCTEVRALGFRLLELIAESLGLEKEYLTKALGEQEQHMAINYYPPCPEPELTYGLPAHTDPNALTILLQDTHVSGLQILKNGNWIRVDPHPDALVVNIGDQLQALSNARYKSVWHRAVVNANCERMSMASFLCPCNDVVISPAEKLTGDHDPAAYRSYTYDEYYKKFWGRNLDQGHCLELFKN